MATRTALKRSATSAGADGLSAKKTRFVEPDEDPVNFAEQIDSALEDPMHGRRNRVKTEGYDSDSSDDGEGVVESRKKGTNVADDDDDMFAMDDGKDTTQADPKKKAEYLRLGDIEGQEFGGGNQTGRDSDDDESDEPEDEDDAERRQKAGMGYELSSFNMRDEMEEGKFTEDGTYVRTFDAHAVHDRWMDGVDEKQMKQARKRKKHREQEQLEKMKAEEEELEKSGGPKAMEKELLGYLKKGETVFEALQRLGQKNKKTKNNTSASPIELITHLASTVMSYDIDIYSRTYEELVRSVRSSGLADAKWEPPSADTKYEYKWAVENPENQVFGPFSEEEMRSWHKADYFGSFGEKVKVREVNGEWTDWDNIL